MEAPPGHIRCRQAYVYMIDWQKHKEYMAELWIVAQTNRVLAHSQPSSNAEEGSAQVRVRVRFKAVKVHIFGGLSLTNPTEKARPPSAFRGKSLCPSTVPSRSEHN